MFHEPRPPAGVWPKRSPVQYIICLWLHRAIFLSLHPTPPVSACRGTSPAIASTGVFRMRGDVARLRAVCGAGLDYETGRQTVPKARLGRRTPHLFHHPPALPHEQQRIPGSDRGRPSVLGLSGFVSGGCLLSRRCRAINTTERHIR